MSSAKLTHSCTVPNAPHCVVQPKRHENIHFFELCNQGRHAVCIFHCETIPFQHIHISLGTYACANLTIKCVRTMNGRIRKCILNGLQVHHAYRIKDWSGFGRSGHRNRYEFTLSRRLFDAEEVADMGEKKYQKPLTESKSMGTKKRNLFWKSVPNGSAQPLPKQCTAIS